MTLLPTRDPGEHWHALKRLVDRGFGLRPSPTHTELLLTVSELDLIPALRRFATERELPKPDDRDVLDVLSLVNHTKVQYDLAVRRAIEMARRRGITWPYIAYAMDFRSEQGAQGKYQRLTNGEGKANDAALLPKWQAAEQGKPEGD